MKILKAVGVVVLATAGAGIIYWTWMVLNTPEQPEFSKLISIILCIPVVLICIAGIISCIKPRT